MKPEWSSTYRLQLHAGFPLAAAGKVLPYLRKLGISHVYLSPCLQARDGSQHGYDVTDPTRVSSDLGGEPAWKEFCAQARTGGLGVLLDIVPNHMAVGPENPWWDDVLAHGRYSRFASFFDISAEHGEPVWLMHLATLGQSYGATLAAGEFAIDVKGPKPRLTCGPQSWPLYPASWKLLTDGIAEALPALAEMDRLAALVEPNDADRETYRQLVGHLESQWSKLDQNKIVANAARLQRNPDAMHQLIQQQNYALHYWKLEGEVVNYRRFFDVAGLVGIKMEDERVHTAAHERIAKMVEAGEVQGLRVDHPDGLSSPHDYFQRLRALLPDGRIYAEKILADDEMLRDDWAVDGTVGYDFLNRVNRLWMSEQKADVLSSVYADFTGHTINFPEIVREKKSQIIDAAFTADLERLTDLATIISRDAWRTRDLSRRHLQAALRELIVLLPVYRTYLGVGPASSIDRELMTGVLASARARRSDIPGDVFDFFGSLFAAPNPSDRQQNFIARWQQLTPAVTAKGIEDTTFYCYDRLVSCNEVGSQPSLLGISSEQFHQFCHQLGLHWPANMLATATHDHKRGEDVRARISVLTEVTDKWGEAVQQWSRMNLTAWRGRTPDRHAEYLLYQTLVGAWPLEKDRAIEYMVKACREAKITTSWQEPNPRYEEAMRDFITDIYASEEFASRLARFVEPLILPGRINSLGQTLIKLTAPGMPDFYQGTELWDSSLVDPDNRRPVDFDLRTKFLSRADQLSAAEVLQEWDSGLPKLWMITRTLALRKQNPEWFSSGAYQPLTARGSRLGHLLAFSRSEQIITVVPRFTLSLRGEWGDTALPLPAGRWKNQFTGESCDTEILPAQLFRGFPVALLTKQP